MRPERDTIAAPDLPEGIAWIGERPQSMPNLTAAGPVLVHFLDFAQLNSVRTLPYLAEWDRRYREAGLTTIGVQAPRFPFGSEPDPVAAGLTDLGVGFPVAIDAERELWLAYGCEGWPSLFLWTTGGALSWFHFGEGEYLGTEMAIQEELRELDALRSLPEPMDATAPKRLPRREGDAPNPGDLPGRLLGRALDRRRARGSTTKPAAPTRRLRAPARSQSPSTAATRSSFESTGRACTSSPATSATRPTT